MIAPGIREILLEARDRAERKGLKAVISLHSEHSHLMRIGNNSVSLNTSENLTRLDTSVVSGRREGSHTHLGEIESIDGVMEAIEISARKAEVACPKDYDPIPAEIEEDIDQSEQYDATLESLDPSRKAETYRAIFDGAGRDYNYSGSWSSGSTSIYLLTTANRREACWKATDSLFSVVLKHPSRKWELQSEQSGWRSGDVLPERSVGLFHDLLPVYEGGEAIRNEPGDYTVLFGPNAVAELLMMALWTGLMGRMYEEKLGWTAKNAMGDQILGRNVTVVDDPSDPGTFGTGFDFGGMRRRRYGLIEEGRLAGLMYDRSTAAKYGHKPTGHDTNSPSIVMSCGEGPADPLAAAASHGGRMLYIPALHYMNLPNMSKGIVTASSRFNAVLVEDGRIVAPIFSSRVTDTFQNIFGNLAVLSGAPSSVNLSNTYGRRAPVAMSVPSYAIAEKVRITDCADSF